MTPQTLAQRQAALNDTHDHAFCTSLPLYALVERNPKPDDPDWAEVACLNAHGVEGMMVYLSPIDAMIDLHSRNREGRRFQLQPFEALNPRPFIEAREGWFTVCPVYGFAARNGRMMLDEDGDLMPLTKSLHFQVSDPAQHFHMNIPEDFIASVRQLHRLMDYADYRRVADEMAADSLAELECHAREALECVEAGETGKDGITQCGLYDPIEGRWRIASFADVRAVPHKPL